MPRELFNPPVNTDVSNARVRDRLDVTDTSLIGFLPPPTPDPPPDPNVDPQYLFWLQSPPGVLWMYAGEPHNVWFPVAGETDPFAILDPGDSGAAWPNSIDAGLSSDNFEDVIFGGDSASANGGGSAGTLFPGGGAPGKGT